MKKIMGMILLVFGVIFIVGCGNNVGKEAYSEFKERYAVDFDDVDKLDDWTVSIFEANSSYYVKVVEDEGFTRYYSWDIGSPISKGRHYEAQSDFNVGVGNAEPIYEQNMK